MQNKKEFVCRTIFYLLIAATIACVVAASCLLARYPTLGYCLFGGAGAAVLAQLLTAVGVTRSKSEVKVNGYKQWATSIIVFAAITAITALLPAILILRIVDAVQLLTLARRSESDK